MDILGLAQAVKALFFSHTRSCGVMLLPKFEIIVHNSLVRKALDKMQPNDTGFQDKWADNNYLFLEARTREDAKREADRRYPKEKGFVIEWGED